MVFIIKKKRKYIVVMEFTDNKNTKKMMHSENISNANIKRDG